jgi:hypothetical protein
MGFFGRGEKLDGEQAEELARIEGGGIPSRAQERLKALGRPADPETARGGSLYTTGLSVNEFALLDRLGPSRSRR